MSLLKAGALALMIPAALAAPAFAQQGDRQGPPRMIFSELDADGSGAVTLEEMQAAGAGRFAAADTDGDGALSRDELLAQGAARAEQRVDRLLERADADGDGQLSMAEMEDARDARGARGQGRGEGHGRDHGDRGDRGGRGGPNPERMFERMDADGDGQVTQAEFDEAVAQMLERMGRRNGDRG